MTILHFLNVGNGDCSILEHGTSRVTMIDVCKARRPARPVRRTSFLDFVNDQSGRVSWPASPFTVSPLATTDWTNPIEYLHRRNVGYLHRFILTHPDMDHLDGIKDIIAEFEVGNFWDTANTKQFTSSNMFRDEDWRFYMAFRDCLAPIPSLPKRLELYAGAAGAFWNRIGIDGAPHDDLHILAPTPELVSAGNSAEDWNDASYVILQRTSAGRILFWGDAHDGTRAFVLSRYADILRGVEIMIAPHHGRGSDSDRKYLSVIQPKLTLFGCAPSEHLAYDAWSNRGLSLITNKQAGNIIVDGNTMNVFVEKERLARSSNPYTFYDTSLGGWFWGTVR